MEMILGCRPSTPLFDLLEHRYQERWLHDMKEAERRMISRAVGAGRFQRRGLLNPQCHNHCA